MLLKWLTSRNWGIARRLFPSSVLQWVGVWDWGKRAKAFEAFLDHGNLGLTSTMAGNEVIIVIMPWLLTPLPWFMIALALGLRQRGCKVRLIWDDTGFGPESAVEAYMQRCIHKMLGKLPQDVEWLRLSKVPRAESIPLTDVDVKRLVEGNAVIRFFSEDMPADGAQYCSSVESSLKQTAYYVQGLFQCFRPAYAIVPGGVYRSSSLFVQLGKKQGVRIGTIDSGFGVMMLCVDGVTAFLADIPRSCQMLAIDDGWVIKQAQAELKRRMQGQYSFPLEKGEFSFQAVASAGREDKIGVLLPLSISFDTSALGLHRVFKNQTEWMLQTVDWILKNTKETVVVRQHPGERISGFRSKDNYQGALNNHFGSSPRIRFIAPEDSINTYDLIRCAKVMVTYISTVGVEAAALGKPVITVGACYYADLGFVWPAFTRVQYFELLAQGLDGKLAVSKKQSEQAWRCYYLTQCCNFYRTTFTPMPSDFDQWVRNDPGKVLASDSMRDILDAFESNVPLAIIQHQHLKSAGNNQ